MTTRETTTFNLPTKRLAPGPVNLIDCSCCRSLCLCFGVAGRVIDEEEDEEEEEEEEDEEDETPVLVEEPKKSSTTTTTTTTTSAPVVNPSRSADYKDDAAPKVSPVAVKPSYSRDDEDFDVDGSGAGGSGAGSDDEDDEEDEEEEDGDDDVDVPPVITDSPVRPPVPEKKPEVMLVPQPTSPSVVKEFQPPAPTSTPPTHVDVPAETPTTSPPVDPNASDVHVIDHKPDDRPAFFAQPGILAGIVFVSLFRKQPAKSHSRIDLSRFVGT